MKREDQISQLKELIKQLEDGTTVDAGGIIKVPAETYTCEDRFKQEWDVFFKNHAQIIGASADLPEPGSFFTLNDFGIPILATRDEEGNFHAFANICSHRASIVEKETRVSGQNLIDDLQGVNQISKKEMTQPIDIANICSTILNLPNPSIPFEVSINCNLETQL